MTTPRWTNQIEGNLSSDTQGPAAPSTSPHMKMREDSGFRRGPAPNLDPDDKAGGHDDHAHPLRAHGGVQDYPNDPLQHPDARDAAKLLIGSGFHVIAYDTRQKNPFRAEWQKENPLAIDDLNSLAKDANLGVMMVNGLVDADCDWPEAVRIGPRRLPETAFRCGRASTPEAHRFYVSDLRRSVLFDDPTVPKKSGGTNITEVDGCGCSVASDDKARIIELRTAGAERKGVQTCVYGVHPNGEPVRFVSPSPAKVAGGTLVRAAGAVAAASLLAKHLKKNFTPEKACSLFTHFKTVTDVATARQIMEDVEFEITGTVTLDLSAAAQGESCVDLNIDGRILVAIEGWLNADVPTREDNKEKKKLEKTTPRPVIRRLDSVEPKSIDWLWKDYIAWGKLTGLVGDPGVSKSTFTVDLAARITTGGSMPDGSPGKVGGVIFICAEDDDADTIVPRLMAAGADLSHCASVTTVEINGSETLVTLDSHIAQIEEAITSMGRERVVVVIDPLNAFLGRKRNALMDQDLRSVLTPLAKLAGRTGAAVVLVTHFNRGEAASAIAKVGGGTGLIGAVRSGLVIAHHPNPNEADRRVIAVVKQNLAKRATAFEYNIHEVNDNPVIQWIGPCDYTANDLVQPPPTREERSAVEDAIEFVRQLLADGPRPSAEVDRLAREHGHNKASIKRGKAGVFESKKFRFTWYYRLVGDCREPAVDEVDNRENVLMFGAKEVK